MWHLEGEDVLVVYSLIDGGKGGGEHLDGEHMPSFGVVYGQGVDDGYREPPARRVSVPVGQGGRACAPVDASSRVFGIDDETTAR
jgi:hypothetical protein